MTSNPNIIAPTPDNFNYPDNALFEWVEDLPRPRTSRTMQKSNFRCCITRHWGCLIGVCGTRQRNHTLWMTLRLRGYLWRGDGLETGTQSRCGWGYARY